MHPDFEKMLEQMGGSRELLEEIVNLFFEDCRQDLNAIQEAIRLNNTCAIIAPAHGLKGELGNLGAATAYRLAADLEVAGKEGRLDDVNVLLYELIQKIEELESFFSCPDWQEKL